jgi:hypothetical protein
MTPPHTKGTAGVMYTNRLENATVGTIPTDKMLHCLVYINASTYVVIVSYLRTFLLVT